MNHNLIGLARVSTGAQDAQLQQDALALAGCGPGLPREGQHPQGRCGAPGLTAALGYLRPDDMLVVWKLDRLGRSVKEVLTIADDLHAQGIGVRILTGKLAGSYSPSARAGSFSS
jgi:DNA invertase Pin-like site-specific DNA recombinase